MGIFAAIIVLGILIFIHELGHFAFAKLFGVKVERFSIGFGPILAKWGKGETEYALSAVPLGGYVKMYGEAPDAPVEDAEIHRSFSHKSLSRRAMIVAAGPLFNILLAVIVFAVVFMMGVPRPLAVIGGTVEGLPAETAGLQEGDRIVAIDGEDVVFWDEMNELIQANSHKTLEIVVERGNEIFTLDLKPETSTVQTVFGEDAKKAMIGVSMGSATKQVRYGPIASIGMGFSRTWEYTVLTFVSIGKMIQRVVPADQIGGPIMIVQMASSSAEAGIANLLFFMAIISINLAILNILPIPVLDGGHLFFYAVEAITRRPVSIKVREFANMVGLALILTLMFFVFYNDIARIIRS